MSEQDRTTTTSINDPCSKWIISNRIISKIDVGDEREVSLARRLQVLGKRHEKARRYCEQSKRAYWYSLSAPKHRSTSDGYGDRCNDVHKKFGWSMKRLIELSKPKIDHYEYSESIYYPPAVRTNSKKEVVTSVNHTPYPSYSNVRITELISPRKMKQETIKWTLERKDKKVPLSVLMPRINALSRASTRMDEGEDIKTYEESFLVKESSLKYVATERIKRLSTPKRTYFD